MSRANAQVKFPDGTIKHGIYNGTADVYMEYLYDTSEQAWDAWQKFRDSHYNDELFRNKEDTEEFDVEIADDYGSGDCYLGRATKSEITSVVNIDYMQRKGNGGKPKWWLNDDDEGGI